MISILPCWKETLDKTPPPATPSFVGPLSRLPKKTSVYSECLTFVNTSEGVRDLIQLAHERPISWIGFDTEYRFDRPAVTIKKDVEAVDVRSVHPLLLSLSLVEPESDDQLRIYRFVVDVRQPELAQKLESIFRLPVPFVAHFARAELHCLWQLQLREPAMLWDTWVAEKVRYMGLYNTGYAVTKHDAGDAAWQQAAETDERIRYSLVDTCRRHGVPYELAHDKKRLQSSFLDHRDGEEFSPQQIEYAALDATAAASLYPLQVSAAVNTGAIHHLVEIEMPWTVVNARIIWNGVRIDPVMRDRVRQAGEALLPEVERNIREHGIENHRSHPQLCSYFESAGLLHAFAKKGGYSFDKDQIKNLKHIHPVIPLLIEAKRIQSLTSDMILTPAFDGTDGRVHADHKQLAADSGRNSCRHPNLLGLDRTMRPLVVPDPGHGIGEVDLAQIEIGISAAVYGDGRLTEMYNTGDVYSAMAQLFYKDQLPPEAMAMTGNQFKKAYPDMRSQMKTCTLGIIYGLTPHGLSVYLGVTVEEAGKVQERFMTMFPVLERSLKDASHFGGLRGYASTDSGLKRHRGRTGEPTGWENNWLRNHPVQGSAADVFKAAGVRLDKLYQQYMARLIIPVHDAYVFEAPTEHLQVVAELTARVMCEAVQERFPQLRPRCDININHSECWNKDGMASALRDWCDHAVQTAEVVTNN